MAKKGEKEILCAYCARPYGEYTKDHVFPRSWYPDTTPLGVQRWTVPCCLNCNQEKSRLENYSLQRLAACVDTGSAPAQGIWERVFRGFSTHAAGNDRDREHRRDAREALLREIVPATRMHAAALAYLTPVRPPGSIGLTVVWKKVLRLMELFARGCHSHIEHEPLPSNADVQCYFPRSYSDIREVMPLITQSTFYDLGPGIMFRRGFARDNNQQASLYVFQFWGRLHFFVTAFAPLAAKGPANS